MHPCYFCRRGSVVCDIGYAFYVVELLHKATGFETHKVVGIKCGSVDLDFKGVHDVNDILKLMMTRKKRPYWLVLWEKARRPLS